MNTVQLGVWIPSHLNERLTAYLSDTGLSKTEIVIHALASYLGCSQDLPLTE